MWAKNLNFAKMNGMFRTTDQKAGIRLSNLHSLGSVSSHEVWRLSLHVLLWSRAHALFWPQHTPLPPSSRFRPGRCPPWVLQTFLSRIAALRHSTPLRFDYAWQRATSVEPKEVTVDRSHLTPFLWEATKALSELFHLGVVFSIESHDIFEF